MFTITISNPGCFLVQVPDSAEDARAAQIARLRGVKGVVLVSVQSTNPALLAVWVDSALGLKAKHDVFQRIVALYPANELVIRRQNGLRQLTDDELLKLFPF